MVWRPGDDSRFSVYNAKPFLRMSTISLHRKAAVPVRIIRTSVATAAAVVATVLTIVGIAIASDPLAYLAATAGLASIFSLDQKGGDR